MKNKVLLKDIALAADVSPALVSYVMNNRYENRIKKETAEKIRKIAKEMGYVPNQIAKSLKIKKTFTIGLMLGDIMNPFSYHIARIIEDEAKKYNYTVIFGSCDENKDQSKKLMDTLINRQVDGFIIAAAADTQSQLKRLQQMEIPFILIDRYFPEEKFNYISIDNYGASFQAVTHLAKTGRKKIAIINYDSELVHLQNRTKGYIDALKASKIEPKKEWICNVRMQDNPENIRNEIASFLKNKKSIDALFVTTNGLTLHTLKLLNKLEIKVPDDLAIVCFDETDAVELFYSPLTFVKQPMQQMGSLAVQTLLKQIEKNDNQLHEIVLETTFVVNKSSGVV